MIGYFEILGAVSIWAIFNGLLVKLIKTSGVGVGTWTAVVGIIIFSIAFILLGVPHELSSYQLIILSLLGIFAALNNSLGYTAIKISITMALLFHYLAPVFVPLWGLVFDIFYQPLGYVSISAIVIALLGMILLAVPNLREGNKKLILLGMGSAIFYSLEIVFSGYLSKDLHVPAEVSAFTKLIFQASVMPIMALLLNESLKVQDRADWLKIIAGGTLLCVSFVMYFLGAKTVDPVQLGILGYIDRVGAIGLGAYFFKEKISRNTVIGGVMILGAGLLVIFVP
jgi:drug/metabolite transporter (DMT)-like permease